MRSAPRLSLARLPHNDQPAIAALDSTTAGQQESADVRLTAGHRRFVRRLVTVAEKVLSDEGLLYLAGGAEDAAQRKRTAEEACGR
jgi:hypothetical protein